MNIPGNYTKTHIYISLILAITIFNLNCTRDPGGELGSLPKADFDVVKTNANNIILVNHSSISSIPYWTIMETGVQYKGDSAKTYLGFAYTYHIQMLIAGKGGMDSITKTVSVDSNDPGLCANGTVQNFLSGCTQKQWRLLQDADALGVGGAEGDISWWSSSADDVTNGRPCTFNDVFTFKMPGSLFPANNFLYDGKGDYYTEDYLGPADGSCANESTLTGNQKAWATNTTDFSYQLLANAGTHPGLGQLKLIGKGAHIALPKVQNGGQETSGPLSDNLIYNITDTAHDASGNSILTLSIESPSGVWWQIKLSTN